MTLRYDEIAVLRPYDEKKSQQYHTNIVKIDTDCFKHKKYPNCKCGAKYVPIKDRKMCPRCYSEKYR